MKNILILLLIVLPLHSRADQDPPLPRGYLSLELGASFDTASPEVSTFSE